MKLSGLKSCLVRAADRAATERWGNLSEPSFSQSKPTPETYLIMEFNGSRLRSKKKNRCCVPGMGRALGEILSGDFGRYQRLTNRDLGRQLRHSVEDADVYTIFLTRSLRPILPSPRYERFEDRTSRQNGFRSYEAIVSVDIEALPTRVSKGVSK